MDLISSLKHRLNIKRASAIAGLHIGASSLRLLELSQIGGDKLSLVQYATVPLPQGAVLEKEVKDSAAITAAVKQLVLKTGGKIRDVAIALPDNATISKVIQVDASLNELKLEEMIHFEAEQHLPHPLDEVSLDFQVLGPNPKNPQILDVLLVASHKNNVETRVAAINAGGMQVKVVDVESYAIERACRLLQENWPEQGQGKTVVVCILSALVMTLFVLHDRSVIFTRSENFGSDQLNKMIQERYQLEYAEAEQAKLNNTLPADYAAEVLEPFEELCLLHIRRSLQFFSSTAQNAEIDHMVLAGGSAQLPGLCEKVAEQLNLPVTVADPFSMMQMMPDIELGALKKDAPGLLVCAGLALRNCKIN